MYSRAGRGHVASALAGTNSPQAGSTVARRTPLTRGLRERFGESGGA